MNINPETGEVIYAEKPTQSTEINELAAALAKAQGQLTPAAKDADNPYFKSSYATLDSIWRVARAPLSSNGLTVVQLPMFDESGMYLITTLMHLSGQWLRSYYRITPVKADPQGIGSALTYARRYALAAIVGVTTADDDDDGNAASGKPDTKTKDQPKPTTNGKASTVPNTADDLLKLVNQRVTVTYDNVPHLFNAIRQEIGDNWTWPEKKDVDGWRKAYKAAVDHARAKEQPAESAEQGEIQF